MKRILSILLAASLLLSVCSFMTGCVEANPNSSADSQIDSSENKTDDARKSDSGDNQTEDGGKTDADSETSSQKSDSDTGSDSSENLMDQIEKTKEDFENVDFESYKLSDFAIKVLKECELDKNTLISPVSLIYALTMTANGADGKTREQMENLFGADIDELNEYLGAYLASMPSDEKYKFSMGNSIWIKDDPGLTVEEEFLQKNADYYSADVFKTEFSAKTKDSINAWVSEHTDGMIDSIIDKIPDDSIMYLINALAFDAQWETIYRADQVGKGFFTCEDGKEQYVDFMYCTEYDFLSDENSSGFIKWYADRKYAFAALLPKEGMSIEEYIATLDGEKLDKMLSAPEDIKTYTAIPKFSYDYSTEMADIFKELGMTDAFSLDFADFSKLGSYTDKNIFINRILHKCFIGVDEKGTKAGAATAIDMAAGSALETKVERVYLDRPFVYMIIDAENNTPIFIGTVTSLEE